MKPTKLATAAVLGASLLAAAPAFADPGYRGHEYGYRGEHRYHYDRRVVVISERPRYVERRVVVVRPAPVYRPAAVYRPAPVAYGPPVYGGVYYGNSAFGAVVGAVIGAYVGGQIASAR
jgi:uncharacterized protein YcfJ